MKSVTDLKLCSGKSSSMSGTLSLLFSLCPGAGFEVRTLKHAGKRTWVKVQQAAVAAPCRSQQRASRLRWAGAFCVRGHRPVESRSFRTSGRRRGKGRLDCLLPTRGPPQSPGEQEHLWASCVGSGARGALTYLLTRTCFRARLLYDRNCQEVWRGCQNCLMFR